jgi:monofunctional biosynthetic peptidoglycan transglycosylase
MKVRLFKKMGKVLLHVSLSCLLISFCTIVLFKYVPVSYTPLMALRSLENRKDLHYHTRKAWKPLSEIALEMVFAAVALEDMRFASHRGFDWEEIRKARHQHASGRKQRGASTISQQTAKNVFLLPHRSWVRKGLEAYFTLWVEWIWGKERILEVYLNVAETGPGLFGVEAAAQHYFQKPAKSLTAQEAALIASCLPNPLQRSPLHPTPSMKERIAYMERIMEVLQESTSAPNNEDIEENGVH